MADVYKTQNLVGIHICNAILYVVLKHVTSFFLNVMFIYRRYRRTYSEYVKL